MAKTGTLTHGKHGKSMHAYPWQTPCQIVPARCSPNTMATAGTLTPGKNATKMQENTLTPARSGSKVGRMWNSTLQLPAELERTCNRRGRTHLSPDELVPLVEVEQKWNRTHLPRTKWYPRQKWNTHLPRWLDGKIIDLAQTSRIYCC